MAATTTEPLEERMVADYCHATDAREDAVMITQGRADARDLNARTRACLESQRLTTPR